MGHFLVGTGGLASHVGLASRCGHGRRRAQGHWVVEEGRSFLTRRPLPGAWARLQAVCLLEGQVRPGVEVGEGSLHAHSGPFLRGWGTGQGVSEPLLQHPHVLLLPCFWNLPGSVPSSAPHLPSPLVFDTPDRPLSIPTHLQPGC